MIIGQLRERIVLQSQTRASDGMGGSTITWADRATVWAAIWPVSANEQIKTMQNSMAVTHRIRIWYHPDLEAYWRIKYVDREQVTRYFNIISIIDSNMAGIFFDLLVKEAWS